MFIEFFYLLRKRGLKVSLNEWMALMEALNQGLGSVESDVFLLSLPGGFDQERDGIR